MLYGKKLIALCTSRVYDAQVNEFINALNSLLTDKNCVLLVFSINNDMYWEDNNINAGTSVFSLIDFNTIDAVIIMDEKIKSHTVSEKISSAANMHSVPVITIDGKGSGISICFDFEKGFEKIVRHVIEDHAVRRPHFIAGLKDNPFSDKRIEIFREVITENGIPFDSSMVSYGDFWAKPAAEAVQNIIDNGSLPQAFICANDIMAISVCETLLKNGVKVPDDVLVTGFDGLDEIYFSNPKLSSVQCSSVTMAKAVFDALSDIFLKNITKGNMIVEPDLILNRSCGCPEAEIPPEVFGRMKAGFYRYQDDMRLLFNISELMQMSDSPETAASCLHNYLLNDMCCIVNKSCLNVINDYFSSESIKKIKVFEEEMVLLYDYYSGSYKLKNIERSRLAPDLEMLIGRKDPLIFTSLTYMDKPIGYVCFSYSGCSVNDYAKAFQITTALGIGLGGYIIRRHQQYLNDKVEEMYKNDPLTLLYNRNGFYSAFEKLKTDPDHIGKKISIISSDLDGLKYINDNFGHDAGDIAIRTAADALKSSCPEGSLCVRFGGDEMLAIVFGDVPPEEIAERMYSYLEKFNADSGLNYLVNASCGTCSAVFDESFDFDRVSKLADENMYRIKNSRKQN